jgi:hypothetical protein
VVRICRRLLFSAEQAAADTPHRLDATHVLKRGSRWPISSTTH